MIDKEELEIGDVLKCCKSFSNVLLNERYIVVDKKRFPDGTYEYLLKFFPLKDSEVTDYDLHLFELDVKNYFYLMESNNEKPEIKKEEKDPNNRVNHPDYYNMHPSGIECIDIIRHYCFDIGNAIKYLWRAGLKKEQGLSDKEKEIEDLEKAVFYINDWINHLKSL